MNSFFLLAPKERVIIYLHSEETLNTLMYEHHQLRISSSHSDGTLASQKQFWFPTKVAELPRNEPVVINSRHTQHGVNCEWYRWVKRPERRQIGCLSSCLWAKVTYRMMTRRHIIHDKSFINRVFREAHVLLRSSPVAPHVARVLDEVIIRNSDTRFTF